MEGIRTAAGTAPLTLLGSRTSNVSDSRRLCRACGHHRPRACVAV